MRKFLYKGFFLFALLVLCRAENVFGWSATLNTNGGVAAATVYAGNTIIIQTFKITTGAGGASPYAMTGLYFTTTGTYATTDVTKFKLWYSTTNDITTANQAGADLSSSTAGNQT